MNPSAPVLVKNGILLTFGDGGEALHGSDLLIRDGAVFAIGPRDEVAALARDLPDLVTLDAAGRVVTPGLVNAHMHLYSTFACGIAAEASHDFPEILQNLWWRLDAAMNLDDVRLSAVIPAVRSLKAGVTTIVDHHASFGAITGSLGAIAGEVRRLGLRASLCYEVSDRAGPAKAEEGIRENADFLASLPGRADPDLHGLFGLHASLTLSEATLAASLDAAKGAGFHVHVAEDVSDVNNAKAHGFAGAADRLLRLGILRPGSIAGHCIHVTDDEVRRLAAAGVTVVTNPQSNMNNAVGVAGVPELLAAGCTVGLGSDGMTADVLEEARAEIFTQRQRLRDPTRMFCEAFDLVARTNPAIASAMFGRPIGVLRPGAAGDAVIWDYAPGTPLHSGNVAGHVLFGLAASRPRTVVASGRVVLDDFVVPGLDEAAIAAEARRLSAALWERW